MTNQNKTLIGAAVALTLLVAFWGGGQLLNGNAQSIPPTTTLSPGEQWAEQWSPSSLDETREFCHDVGPGLTLEGLTLGQMLDNIRRNCEILASVRDDVYKLWQEFEEAKQQTSEVFQNLDTATSSPANVVTTAPSTTTEEQEQ